MMRDLGDPNPPCSFVSFVVNVFDHPMKKSGSKKVRLEPLREWGLF